MFSKDDLVNPSGDSDYSQYVIRPWLLHQNTGTAETVLHPPVISSGSANLKSASRERNHFEQLTEHNNRGKGNIGLKEDCHKLYNVCSPVSEQLGAPRNCHRSEKHILSDRESCASQSLNVSRAVTRENVTEAKIDWMTTYESHIQLQPVIEPDDQMLSKLEITEENQPAIAVVQPPLVTKLAAFPSSIKPNGTKTTDANFDELSPYTSPSLTIEEEINSSMVKLRYPFEGGSSPTKAACASSNMKQSTYLSQMTWHKQEPRRMRCTLSHSPNTTGKRSRRWCSRDLIVTLFGCVKTNAGDDGELTRSSFSRIDITQDSSGTEDQRTSAISASSPQTNSATHLPLSPVETISTKKSKISQSPINSTSPKAQSKRPKVRLHMPIVRNQCRILGRRTLLRASKSLTRVHQIIMQLINQHNHEMEIVNKEFANVQHRLVEINTRIDLMTRSLESQQQVLSNITQWIEGHRTVEIPQCSERPTQTVKIASTKQSAERPRLESEQPNPMVQTEHRKIDTTPKQDYSITQRHSLNHKLSSSENRPSSVASVCVSPPISAYQSQKLSCRLISPEEYTLVTEHYSKQSDESSYPNTISKNRTIGFSHVDTISIRKPSFLCSNQGDGCRHYFSEVTVQTPQNVAPEKASKALDLSPPAQMDVVCYSQQTSHSSSSTSPTVVQEDNTKTSKENHDLRRYYRIAYIEQDTAGSQDAVHRNSHSNGCVATTAHSAESGTYRSQKSIEYVNFVQPKRVLKEAKLVAAEFVPCSPPDSDAMPINVPNMIEHKTEAAKDSHHLVNRKSHVHHGPHRAHQREQFDQRPTNRKSSSTCRRQMLIADSGNVVRQSHTSSSTRHRTTIVRTCENIPRDLSNRSGTDMCLTESLINREYPHRTVPGRAIPVEQTRSHHPCPRQHHTQQSTTRHVQMDVTSRDSISNQCPNVNRSSQHKRGEGMCKSKHHHIPVDRNNNSQDWGPDERMMNSPCQSNHIDLTQLSYEEMCNKSNPKFHFITSLPNRSLAELMHTNSGTKPTEFALPGPEEDNQMSLVEHHMTAKREKKRLEDERRIWNELRRLPNQNSKKVTETSNKNDERSTGIVMQPPTSVGVTQTPEKLAKIPGANSTSKEEGKQSSQPMTALERCREQRRRRLEEKTQADMKSILAMTEQAVAERKARSVRTSPQQSAQIKQLLIDKPTTPRGIGDSQERDETESIAVPVRLYIPNQTGLLRIRTVSNATHPVHVACPPIIPRTPALVKPKNPWILVVTQVSVLLQILLDALLTPDRNCQTIVRVMYGPRHGVRELQLPCS
ncbi:unnamed protein product [Echinostoma caproni]|uniref:Coiled-coil domain-containing protein 52 n=1 Tax=Echinostoma caproni TaxID=27848 RepID=A0A183AS84_9TREM|nr:unnamed protein product [Echinostoma caproni]